MKDFEKSKNAVTDFIDYIQGISSIPDENEEATRDSLMANALALNLIPEGNVPRDGNCMYHAVAHGLSVNGNSLNQEEVRNAAAKWLEDNKLINGDVHLPDFLYGMGWEEYLNGLRGAEWGDQISLIGIANAFGVAIGIVSSLHVDRGIQYIYPQNSIVGQPCIFMGHEFESHYIRLVPLYETAPMPQSDQQTVEEHGSAGDDQLNSDIRDASDDDQPSADIIGTANEKHSADSFGDSVDDHQCVDNRRKADENEQSTDGLCHVVDDQQTVYRGAADDDQQSVNVHNEECGGRQLAYCTRPCNICGLPDEILHLLFEQVASGGGTNIGLMRDTWADSPRVQCLLNDVTQPMVHIGEDIMRCLGGTSSVWSGVEYRVTICKLIRLAGKFSGLAMRLKELFCGHPRWYQSVIILLTTGLPGWFNVRDFVPPKGW